MNCLSLCDKQALLRKYMDQGAEFDEAKEMVTEFNKGQIELGKKLRASKKNEVNIKEELQKKFGEEFQKLYSN